MVANLALLLTSAVLISTGVYLVLDRAMTKMMLGLMLLTNGGNLLLLQAGGHPGSPPIMNRQSTVFGDQIADPLAQGMILTAIVISMAMTAFMLSLAYRQFRYRNADVVEDDLEDASIAARPARPSAAPDHDASDDPSTGAPTSLGDAFGPECFELPVKGDKK